ncbi:MAG: transposase, partial [Verrucomicrobiales bacterium]|nr:transposase [Verrucomicrobiales bacterium]
MQFENDVLKQSREGEKSPHPQERKRMKRNVTTTEPAAAERSPRLTPFTRRRRSEGVLPKCQIAEKFLKCPSRVFATEVRHMMSIHKPHPESRCYQVNLETRVREDNPLRLVNQVLDLSFVHPIVSGFYGTKGHPSLDPVVIVKLMLLLFLDTIPSERELMRIVPERLDYLWFLGYSLDERIPDHSVLSKARRKWGQEVFKE